MRSMLAQERARKRKEISQARKALNKRWNDGGHNKEFSRMKILYEPHENDTGQTIVSDVYEQYVDSKLKLVDPSFYEYRLCRECGNMYYSRGVCKCNFDTKLREA